MDGEYAMALQYIDSAMICLNEHYGRYAEEPRRYMALAGDDTPAELDWWNRMFNSDFHCDTGYPERGRRLLSRFEAVG